MKTRIITAVVALCVFIPVLYFGGLALQIVAALLGVIGVYELFRMKGLALKSFEGILASVGVLFLILPVKDWFFFMPKTTTNFTLFYIVFLLFLISSVLSKNRYTLDEAAFPVLVTLYVGVGFQNLVVARNNGLIILFYALLVVWATDIGAYFFGIKFGKNKLAPTISPNKSIEGSVGGILSALIVGVIYFSFYTPTQYFGYSFISMFLFTIIFSIMGQMGDLVESAYKRHYGVKDSGNILPGHGGILDRFDSLLFVFPVMHILGLF